MPSRASAVSHVSASRSIVAFDDRICDRHAERPRQRLCASDCARERLSGRVGSPPRRPSSSSVRRNDTLTSPAACASVRVDELAGHEQRPRLALADAGHDIGADRRRDEAKPRFRQPESCAVRQRWPRRRRREGRRRRRRHCLGRGQSRGFAECRSAPGTSRQPPGLGHPLGAVGFELRAHPAEIAAGAKARTLARQHDNPTRTGRRPSSAGRRRVSSSIIVGRQRIVLFRPGKRQARDAASHRRTMRSVSKVITDTPQSRGQSPRPAASFSSSSPVSKPRAFR